MHSGTLDILIVGQGLAGSALAWHLMQSGKKVVVADDIQESSSSSVAAGLINPLAGRRFSPAPETDRWMAAAERWYGTLEDHFGHPFYKALPMLRLFRNQQQRERFQRVLASGGLAAYVAETAIETDQSLAACPFGAAMQRRTGYVDTSALLAAVRQWLIGRQALESTSLDYADLTIEASTVTWKHYQARQVVFCEGAALRFNPWFAGLPLQPAKGEILDIRAAGLADDKIINGAYWLLPLGEQRYRFGATHDHDTIDTVPTPQGRDCLLDAFRTMFPGAYDIDVQAHRAGIRPGTPDRYPFLGTHPEQPCLHVCNGFGARGALTIPYHAGVMADYLGGCSSLPEAADIRRFQ